MIMVYLILNTVNEKVYIGQTTKSLPQRWSEHLHASRQGKGYYLHKAIRKYGEDCFEIYSLMRADMQDIVDESEIFWIKFFESTSSNHGYNLASGGLSCAVGRPKGFKHSEATKQRIKTALRNSGRMKLCHERLSKLFTGKPLTAEHRQKLSLAKKGKPWSPARRAALENKHGTP